MVEKLGDRVTGVWPFPGGVQSLTCQIKDFLHDRKSLPSLLLRFHAGYVRATDMTKNVLVTSVAITACTLRANASVVLFRFLCPPPPHVAPLFLSLTHTYTRMRTHVLFFIFFEDANTL